MNNFIEIDMKINKSRLLQCVDALNIEELLYKNQNQISVHHRGLSDSQQLTEGTQSLVFDWSSYDPSIHETVPRRPVILDESDFNVVCDLFKNTYIEELIDNLTAKYTSVFRGRFMLLNYKTCLSMHHDDTPRIHIPIITNPDCFMVLDKTIITMEVGKAYAVNTRYPHTAINAGKKDRIHLIFCYGKIN